MSRLQDGLDTASKRALAAGRKTVILAARLMVGAPPWRRPENALGQTDSEL
jgi:hypothetical protein